MSTPRESERLLQSLKLSQSPIAERISSLWDAVRVDINMLASHPDLAPTLRTRLDIKRMQIARAVSVESKARFETIAGAISHFLEWWDLNPTIPVRYISMSMDPDACFIVWLRSDTEEFLDGFESRDATRLSYARGKEFFGRDWEPTPDPNVG
jgi:hypothetical protein